MTLLIVLVIVLGLLASITDSSYFKTLFWVCFGATLCKGVMLWI